VLRSLPERRRPLVPGALRGPRSTVRRGSFSPATGRFRSAFRGRAACPARTLKPVWKGARAGLRR